jgi:hypothetical protein
VFSGMRDFRQPQTTGSEEVDGSDRAVPVTGRHPEQFPFLSPPCWPKILPHATCLICWAVADSAQECSDHRRETRWVLKLPTCHLLLIQRELGIRSSATRCAVTNLAMPAMSPTMTEGAVAQWKKQEGELFVAGDVLLEIVRRGSQDHASE